MADKETDVVYKAIADFSALSAAMAKAKADMAALQAQEASLNAESVTGAQKSTTATTAKTKALKDAKDMTDQEAAAIEKSLSNTIKETAAKNAALKVTKEATAAKKDEVAVTSTLSGLLSGLGTVLSNLTGRHKESTKSAEDQAKSLEKIRAGAIATGSAVDQLNKILSAITGASTSGAGPGIAAPFLIVIPVIAGLIALLDPLVALLGAIGGAAIGLAANLGSLAGASLAIIPGITALIGTLGALRIAFSGVGGAFSAFSAMSNAAGGGGGGGGKSAAQQLQALTVAQQAYTNSISAVERAQTSLDTARVTALRNLQALQLAVDRAQASEAASAANLQLATENYYNVLANPASTKGQKEKALADLTDAQNALADVQTKNAQNQQDLNKQQALGVEGNAQVVAAKDTLTRAVQAQNTALYNLNQAQSGSNAAAGGGAAATNAYAAALAKLSPAAQQFVKTLVSMKSVWVDFRKTIQEDFFSQFVNDLGRITRLVQPLKDFFGEAAVELGKLADAFLKMATSSKWLSDFSVMGGINAGIIRAMGQGLLSLLDAFKNLSIIAGPFAIELSQGLASAADNFDRIVSNARDSGSLASWLEVIRARLAVWWDIVKNVAMTLVNFGAAAGSFGQWITDGLDNITKNWLKVSEDAKQKGSPFRTWLEDIKPLLTELRGLVGDIFKSFGKTSADKGFISQAIILVQTLRDNFGPAFSSLLDTLGKTGAGTTVIKAISDVITALSSILKNGGSQAIGDFVNIFVGFFDFLAKIAGNPIIGPFVGHISELAASLLAISLIGRFTGVLGFLGTLDNMAKNPAVIKFLAGLSGITVPTPGTIPLPGAPTGKPGKIGGTFGSTTLGEPLVLPSATGAAGGVKGAVGGVAKLGAIGAVVAATTDAVVNDIGTIGNVLNAGGKKGATQDSVNAGAAKDGGFAKGAIPALGIVSDVVGIFSPSAKKSIDKWLQDVSKSALDWVTGLPGRLKKEAKDFWNFFPKILPWFFDRGVEFGKWVKGLPSALVKDAKDLWNYGLPAIDKWLEAQLKALFKWAKSVAFELGKLTGQFWYDGIPSALGWLSAQLGHIIGWFTSLPGKILKLGVDIWKALPGVLAWLDKRLADILGWIIGIPAQITKQGVNIWNGLPGVLGWLEDRATDILRWVKGLPGRIASLGVNLLSGLGGAFNLGFTSVGNRKVGGSADGGLVGFAGGGKVIDGKTGSLRDAGTDTVPTMLTPGEYVLRKAVVDMLGVAKLDRLNSGGASFNGNGMSFFSGGGLVDMPKLSTGRLGMSGGGSVGTPGNTWNFGDIIINNPLPETSSDSIPSALRKVAYISNGRRQSQPSLGGN